MLVAISSRVVIVRFILIVFDVQKYLFLVEWQKKEFHVFFLYFCIKKGCGGIVYERD